jgi:hypothetical protein
MAVDRHERRESYTQTKGISYLPKYGLQCQTRLCMLPNRHTAEGPLQSAVHLTAHLPQRRVPAAPEQMHGLVSGNASQIGTVAFVDILPRRLSSRLLCPATPQPMCRGETAQDRVECSQPNQHSIAAAVRMSVAPRAISSTAQSLAARTHQVVRDRERQDWRSSDQKHYLQALLRHSAIHCFVSRAPLFL